MTALTGQDVTSIIVVSCGLLTAIVNWASGRTTKSIVSESKALATKNSDTLDKTVDALAAHANGQQRIMETLINSMTAR